MSKLNVFISWSGSESRQIAIELRSAIVRLNDGLDPWMSEVDIGKGTQWFKELYSKLGESFCGISVVTKENINAPWLLFEAGAILKGAPEGRCFTFIHGLMPGDIPPPLGLFQATRVDVRAEMRQALTNLNKLTVSPVIEDVFEERFNQVWTSFSTKLAQFPAMPSTPVPIRADRELLEEALAILRARKPLTAPNQNSDAILVQTLWGIVSNSKADYGLQWPARQKLIALLTQSSAAIGTAESPP